MRPMTAEQLLRDVAKTCWNTHGAIEKYERATPCMDCLRQAIREALTDAYESGALSVAEAVEPPEEPYRVIEHRTGPQEPYEIRDHDDVYKVGESVSHEALKLSYWMSDAFRAGFAYARKVRTP